MIPKSTGYLLALVALLIVLIVLFVYNYSNKREKLTNEEIWPSAERLKYNNVTAACGGKLYYIEDGIRRKYLTDASYIYSGSPKQIGLCEVANRFPDGSNMPTLPGNIQNGRVYDCNIDNYTDTYNIYKIENDKKRLFPPGVGYDVTGTRTTTSGCEYINSIPDGPPMNMDPLVLKNGHSVICNGKGYFISYNKKRWYPTQSSYDQFNKKTPWITTRCEELSKFKDGDDMIVPDKLPADINNKMTLRCNSTGKIYKIQNNTKRWYPNYSVYTEADRPQWYEVSCDKINQIPDGSNMRIKDNGVGVE